MNKNSKTFRKLVTRPRSKAFIIWLLWYLPTFLAVRLAHNLTALPMHIEDDRHCLPCQAKKRIEHASHKEALGQTAKLYCSKCGLDKPKWPRYCANKVVQVNYRPPRPSNQHYHRMYWE